MLTQPELAAWLVRIARDLRTAGDVKLVEVTEDGISDCCFTLADELQLVAMHIDYGECMRLVATEVTESGVVERTRGCSPRAGTAD